MTSPITLTLTIDDPALLAGVEYARSTYNGNLPDAESASTIADGASYLTFVITAAVTSYARQKIMSDFEAGDMTGKQRDAALAALPS